VLVKTFPGEGHKETDVIVVKTHGSLEPGYKRIVLLVRNPLEAMKSEHMRVSTGRNHTGYAKTINPESKNAFNMKLY
jgi:hypothetical protein